MIGKRTAGAFAATAMVLAGCTLGADEPTDDGVAPTPQGSTSPPRATTCTQPAADNTPVDTGSLAGDVLALSRELFGCATDVVVADGADARAVTAGAQLAAELDGPMLLAGTGLAEELARLEPSAVHLLGDVDVPVPDAAEVHRVTAAEAGSRAGSGSTDAEGAPTTAGTVGPESAPTPTDGPEGEPTPTGEPDAGPTATQPPDVDLTELLPGLPEPDDADSLWLVDAADPAAAPAMAALALTAGVGILPTTDGDLFADREASQALTGRAPESVRPIGSFPENLDWQLRVLADGREQPGGGYEVFPDDPGRRFVALYGHPLSTGMGALGQQDGPRDALERLEPLVERYAADGATVVPTFNPIATVAHNGGSTGRPSELLDLTSAAYVDYSTMHPPETYREWVDVAAEEDGYVVLDFQPGRNNFLFQVRHYEELIREPHVGIGLDPEWRLGPNEQHLQQIGSVTAEEINEVIDWVAGIVRDEGLPPKLLVIQQFRMHMIENREDIVDRPEVTVAIQMDGEGQGSLTTKDASYRTVTAGTEDAHWRWGWKNFFERDHPDGPYSPEQILEKDPVPVYVTYQ